MTKKKIRLFAPIAALLMTLAVLMTGITFFYNRQLFFLFLGMTCLVFGAVLVMLRLLNKRTKRLLEEMSGSIRYAMGGGFTELPTPVITIYRGREIVWYNELCAEQVFDGRDMRGEDVAEVFPGLNVNAVSPPEGYNIEYGDRMYTVFVAAVETKEGLASVLYLMDDTRLKFYASEYHQSKPTIALLVVDNYEELVQDYKDSERSQLMGEVEQAIDQYIAANHGFVTKVSRDRFLAVIESRGVRNMVAGKFELLDQVRGISLGGRMPATLSMGISGVDAPSLYEGEGNARQALDMCLGRGGDQVAVKTDNGYEFYGGVSKAVEKRTKVKTRIIASALSELVETCSNVVLMGHRFADLDCLGAAVGMMKAIRGMGKPACIAIDREKNLVAPLIDRLLQSGYEEDDFRSPQSAMDAIGPQTLLIVVDTHLPGVLESKELYEAARHVVVIDHHRKLVGHIDNAVIFYHEPYASSASEMVSELVQYLPVQPPITRTEAEALLAGIMLDTKNFVLRTGVRTFEAAAWLRRLGADTVEVRRLFASSIEAYQQRASFIAAAQIYQRCAIAACPESFEGIKLVAPQAADELTTISDVDASFVLYDYDGVINVSARSMGAINVQLIMEKMGGGGHHTMAAAQFPGGSIEEISQQLMEAIDGYYADLSKPA